MLLEEYIDQAPANEKLKATLNSVQNDESFPSFVSSLDEGFAEIFYTVSTILMQDNVKGIATNFLQYAMFFKPEFPLVHFLQAQIFESDEYYRGAQNEFNKIKSDSPLYFQSKLQRAWLYDEMDRSDETIAALLDLEREYPDNREVLNSIAEFYRMHERYTEAIPAYSKVIDNIEKETARDWLIYYTRGIVFDQEKRWDEAEQDLKKALEIKPEQPMVLNYLAYSWVDRGLNYVEAKKMLERAVEQRPNDGYIVDSLGWALYKMGDYEEAVPILECAAQLETQDWAINDHLGDAYWKVGRKNEARFQWRHALSLSPDEDKIDLIKSKIRVGYQKPAI
jgi:Flp pilus assembly protein TadD